MITISGAHTVTGKGGCERPRPRKKWLKGTGMKCSRVAENIPMQRLPLTSRKLPSHREVTTKGKYANICIGEPIEWKTESWWIHARIHYGVGGGVRYGHDIYRQRTERTGEEEGADAADMHDC